MCTCTLNGPHPRYDSRLDCNVIHCSLLFISPSGILYPPPPPLGSFTCRDVYTTLNNRLQQIVRRRHLLDKCSFDIWIVKDDHSSWSLEMNSNIHASWNKASHEKYKEMCCSRFATYYSKLAIALHPGPPTRAIFNISIIHKECINCLNVFNQELFILSCYKI